MNTETRVERFIIDELLLGSRSELEFEEELITSRILDSLALLRLISFIEESFGVTIEDGELLPDNFRTIAAIKSMIESKNPAH